MPTTGKTLQSRKELDNDYKIVLLWLLSETIVNVSYYIVRHVPRTISVPCGLFLKKGGTISCVVTAWPSSCSLGIQEIWKSYSVISSAISSVSVNLYVPFPHKVYVLIRTGPRKYSVPSLMVSITR